MGENGALFLNTVGSHCTDHGVGLLASGLGHPRGASPRGSAPRDVVVVVVVVRDPPRAPRAVDERATQTHDGTGVCVLGRRLRRRLHRRDGRDGRDGRIRRSEQRHRQRVRAQRRGPVLRGLVDPRRRRGGGSRRRGEGFRLRRVRAGAGDAIAGARGRGEPLVGGDRARRDVRRGRRGHRGGAHAGGRGRRPRRGASARRRGREEPQGSRQIPSRGGAPRGAARGDARDGAQGAPRRRRRRRGVPRGERGGPRASPTSSPAPSPAFATRCAPISTTSPSNPPRWRSE